MPSTVFLKYYSRTELGSGEHWYGPAILFSLTSLVSASSITSRCRDAESRLGAINGPCGPLYLMSKPDIKDWISFETKSFGWGSCLIVTQNEWAVVRVYNCMLIDWDGTRCDQAGPFRGGLPYTSCTSVTGSEKNCHIYQSMKFYLAVYLDSCIVWDTSRAWLWSYSTLFAITPHPQ